MESLGLFLTRRCRLCQISFVRRQLGSEFFESRLQCLYFHCEAVKAGLQLRNVGLTSLDRTSLLIRVITTRAMTI